MFTQIRLLFHSLQRYSGVGVLAGLLLFIQPPSAPQTPHVDAAGPASGACTVTTANLTQATVQSAVTAASAGDVVCLPAGSQTWTSGITVTSKGITIRGSGTPTTASSTNGADASCTATAITVNSVSDAFTFNVGTTTSLMRLSCLKILSTDPTTIGPPITAWGLCDSTTCPNLRLDNITFDSSLEACCASQSNSLITTDNIFGVIDHNTMASFSSTNMEFINYMNSAWKGVGDYGDNSWSEPSNFGSASLLYLENNLFQEKSVICETEAQVNGHEGGGRIVARFNYLNGSVSGCSNHGTDSNGRPRGGRQIEFYGNNFICGNAGGCQGAVPVRSGVNIVFSNTLNNRESPAHSWFNQYVGLATYRTQGSPFNGIPWLDCPGPYDHISPSICTDQPSRSGGTLLSGVTPTPTGWTNQVIDPTYEWNDTGYNPVFGNVTDSVGWTLVANTDWYTDNSLGTTKPQTSADNCNASCSPFTGIGTQGAGYGRKLQRPTTCTPFRAYWATDEGSWNTSGNSFGNGNLYICTSTDTWTLSYTPYTYPHPLVQ